MTDAIRSRAVLTSLRNAGVRLAVDDNGTGSSSLAYLRDLPVHELELDRSFVMHLTAETRTAAVVRSTASLAHELGMTMVAEGVEDAPTLDCLAALGCDMAQGHLIARPMASGAFTSWIEQHDGARPTVATALRAGPAAAPLPEQRASAADRPRSASQR